MHFSVFSLSSSLCVRPLSFLCRFQTDRHGRRKSDPLLRLRPHMNTDTKVVPKPQRLCTLSLFVGIGGAYFSRSRQNFPIPDASGRGTFVSHLLLLLRLGSILSTTILQSQRKGAFYGHLEYFQGRYCAIKLLHLVKPKKNIIYR